MKIQKVENILGFCNEVLVQILSQSTDKEQAALVCTKFHELICENNFFSLTIWSECEGFLQLLDDEGQFISLMNSKRRINKLQILGRIFTNDQLESLTRVIEHFGRDVRQLRLHYTELPVNAKELLNSMPNLETIHLNNVSVSNEGIISSPTSLQLKKLKEIKFYCSDRIVLNIFRGLTPDVLQKMSLQDHDDSTSADTLTDLFQFQTNIKELELPVDLTNLINWSSLQLKSLAIFGHFDTLGSSLTNCVKGQKEMKKLILSNLKPGEFKFICNELKGLEHFEIEDVHVQSNAEFSECWKLKQLKKLHVDYFRDCNDETLTGCESLNVLSSESLTELVFSYMQSIAVTASNLKSLSSNMPQLKKLNLSSKSSLNVINTIIQNFKNLEELRLELEPDDDDVYIFQEGMENDRLKRLMIKIRSSNGDFDEMPKLFGCLKNLESFHLIACRFSETFVNESIKALEADASNLKHFHCDSSTTDNFKNIEYELIKKKFKDRFSEINCNKYEWEMDA